MAVTVLMFNISGKVFVKDFFDELRQGNIEVGDEEVEKLQSFADEEGQVTKDDFKHYCKHSELFQSLDKYAIKVGPITFSLARNHDGVVSDLELTSKAELAFKALDKNSDGFISKREFNEISKTLTKEQVSTVYQLIDYT